MMPIRSVDIFIQSATLPNFSNVPGWKCSDIFNRGTRVGPEGKISCHMTDIFQCRFAREGQTEMLRKDILELLATLEQKKVAWTNIHLVL